MAKRDGYTIHALSFRYGQRHERELQSAANVALFLGAKTQKIIQFDLKMIGGSALTDEILVPKGRSEAEISRIPANHHKFSSVS